MNPTVLKHSPTDYQAKIEKEIHLPAEGETGNENSRTLSDVGEFFVNITPESEPESTLTENKFTSTQIKESEWLQEDTDHPNPSTDTSATKGNESTLKPGGKYEGSEESTGSSSSSEDLEMGLDSKAMEKSKNFTSSSRIEYPKSETEGSKEGADSSSSKDSKTCIDSDVIIGSKDDTFSNPNTSPKSGIKTTAIESESTSGEETEDLREGADSSLINPKSDTGSFETGSPKSGTETTTEASGDETKDLKGADSSLIKPKSETFSSQNGAPKSGTETTTIESDSTSGGEPEDLKKGADSSSSKDPEKSIDSNVITKSKSDTGFSQSGSLKSDREATSTRMESASIPGEESEILIEGAGSSSSMNPEKYHDSLIKESKDAMCSLQNDYPTRTKTKNLQIEDEEKTKDGFMEYSAITDNVIHQQERKDEFKINYTNKNLVIQIENDQNVLNSIGEKYIIWIKDDPYLNVPLYIQENIPILEAQDGGNCIDADENQDIITAIMQKFNEANTGFSNEIESENYKYGNNEIEDNGEKTEKISTFPLEIISHNGEKPVEGNDINSSTDSMEMVVKNGLTSSTDSAVVLQTLNKISEDNNNSEENITLLKDTTVNNGDKRKHVSKTEKSLSTTQVSKISKGSSKRKIEDISVTNTSSLNSTETETSTKKEKSNIGSDRNESSDEEGNSKVEGESVNVSALRIADSNLKVPDSIRVKAADSENFLEHEKDQSHTSSFKIKEENEPKMKSEVGQNWLGKSPNFNFIAQSDVQTVFEFGKPDSSSDLLGDSHRENNSESLAKNIKLKKEIPTRKQKSNNNFLKSKSLTKHKKPNSFSLISGNLERNQTFFENDQINNLTVENEFTPDQFCKGNISYQYNSDLGKTEHGQSFDPVPGKAPLLAKPQNESVKNLINGEKTDYTKPIFTPVSQNNRFSLDSKPHHPLVQPSVIPNEDVKNQTLIINEHLSELEKENESMLHPPQKIQTASKSIQTETHTPETPFNENKTTLIDSSTTVSNTEPSQDSNSTDQQIDPICTSHPILDSKIKKESKSTQLVSHSGCGNHSVKNKHKNGRIRSFENVDFDLKDMDKTHKPYNSLCSTYVFKTKDSSVFVKNVSKDNSEPAQGELHTLSNVQKISNGIRTCVLQSSTSMVCISEPEHYISSVFVDQQRHSFSNERKSLPDRENLPSVKTGIEHLPIKEKDDSVEGTMNKQKELLAQKPPSSKVEKKRRTTKKKPKSTELNYRSKQDESYSTEDTDQEDYIQIRIQNQTMDFEFAHNKLGWVSGESEDSQEQEQLTDREGEMSNSFSRERRHSAETCIRPSSLRSPSDMESVVNSPMEKPDIQHRRNEKDLKVHGEEGRLIEEDPKNTQNGLNARNTPQLKKKKSPMKNQKSRRSKEDDYADVSDNESSPREEFGMQNSQNQNLTYGNKSCAEDIVDDIEQESITDDEEVTNSKLRSSKSSTYNFSSENFNLKFSECSSFVLVMGNQLGKHSGISSSMETLCSITSERLPLTETCRNDDCQEELSQKMGRVSLHDQDGALVPAAKCVPATTVQEKENSRDEQEGNDPISDVDNQVTVPEDESSVESDQEFNFSVGDLRFDFTPSPQLKAQKVVYKHSQNEKRFLFRSNEGGLYLKTKK